MDSMFLFFSMKLNLNGWFCLGSTPSVFNGVFFFFFYVFQVFVIFLYEMQVFFDIFIYFPILNFWESLLISIPLIEPPCLINDSNSNIHEAVDFSEWIPWELL